MISANPKISKPVSSRPRLRRPSASRRTGCAPSRRSSHVLFGITEIEGGFPHSEIPGSKPVRGSPGLIAAYHVLHRLSAPRHPPNALKTLDRSHRQRAPFGPSRPSQKALAPCPVQAVPIRLGSLRVPDPEDRTGNWRWTFRKDQFCFKRIREPKRSSQAHD